MTEAKKVSSKSKGLCLGLPSTGGVGGGPYESDAVRCRCFLISSTSSDLVMGTPMILL